MSLKATGAAVFLVACGSAQGGLFQGTQQVTDPVAGGDTAGETAVITPGNSGAADAGSNWFNSPDSASGATGAEETGGNVAGSGATAGTLAAGGSVSAGGAGGGVDEQVALVCRDFTALRAGVMCQSATFTCYFDADQHPTDAAATYYTCQCGHGGPNYKCMGPGTPWI